MTSQRAARTGLREQRRTHREELSRRQFLDAAERVFGHKGFHQTTLREVAEEAEFSVASVYSFFESKEDLLAHIFLRRGGENMVGLRQALATDGTALQRLRRVGDFEIDFFRTHPDFGRLALVYVNTGVLANDRERVPDAIIENYAEVVELLTRLFAAGQQRGDIRPGDAASFARIWLGMISAFHSLDPALSLEPDVPDEPFTRDDFHELVDRAFRL